MKIMQYNESIISLGTRDLKITSNSYHVILELSIYKDQG